MSDSFFERPILNSPYIYPGRHWELDATGQPTGQIVERRRRAEFITPIPKPKKQKAGQKGFVVDESKKTRWETDPRRCHVNWVIRDSDWEAELCRVVESHPRVVAYVKNQGLGLEVPYRMGSEAPRYRPDFIVTVDDGRGPDDLLHLVVEIKGYRGEDAKEKKSTMDTYWVPGVIHLGTFGRWAFMELKEVYGIEAGFAAKVEESFREALAEIAAARE